MGSPDFQRIYHFRLWQHTLLEKVDADQYPDTVAISRPKPQVMFGLVVWYFIRVDLWKVRFFLLRYAVRTCICITWYAHFSLFGCNHCSGIGYLVSDMPACPPLGLFASNTTGLVGKGNSVSFRGFRKSNLVMVKPSCLSRSILIWQLPIQTRANKEHQWN